MHIQTLAVQALRDHEHGAVVPPVHLASTFELDPATSGGDFSYQRGGNPTRAQLETVLAALEDGALEGREQPSRGFAFATGMAATSAAFSLLHTGDEVILPTSVYGGTFRFVETGFERLGLGARWVRDLGELTEADFGESTRMVFVETPTNPTLRVTDLRRIVELAHAHGALVVVDNTFLTPLLQRPLDLGADLVVQSATKYLAGHADLLAGVVTTRDPEIAEKIALSQKTYGGVLSPFDSYRLIQDIKTLPLRLAQQQASAITIAEHLRGHEAVSRVLTPGSHDEREARIQADQADGPGAVLSFELVDGVDRVRFLRALRIPAYAVSLGGVESLICYPATTTHDAMTPQARVDADITEGMLRLSVGIEEVQDLVADLDQALDAAR
ncbi:methionine biosynthesis PLP-dependent protein [Brachybacterium endophyticum]|uniref:homocysteine desulfhydrase n=1 Tax=Brachybacterium endophyticum TaxID=2182385 RepID=A0A2U2RPH6_9MICO|nr:PLP-dependent aspartate aminotransferase family protein [Brachybacterium endophyticum]PWH07664.1 methionine biosynthesis PLP-dependent protein [Brachybacterium endophyticum]